MEVERESIENTFYLTLKLLAMIPNSPIRKFINQYMRGRRRQVFELISSGRNTQDELVNSLKITPSALRKYIAELNILFRQFLGEPNNKHINIIVSLGREKGWGLTIVGKVMAKIMEEKTKKETVELLEIFSEKENE
ncbi:MAG: hypothetical protein ACP6IQ_08720 [Candidatus Njordarchaeia archaeon]